MATVHREIFVDAEPDRVWDALRDFGALHERLVRGFVTACVLDGPDRVVTFANGTVLRERLVSRDEHARRLVWTIVDGPYTHHNGAAQVHAVDGGGSRFVWIADLLPDEAAEATGQAMQRGVEAVKATLEVDVHSL